MPGTISAHAVWPTNRNVFLGDYYGDSVAGFHQYGTVTWESFFQWLSLIIDIPEDWIVVQGDRFAADQYFPSSAIVLPGKYALLAADGSPLHVKLTQACARRRQQTPPHSYPSSENFTRVVRRDARCMVFGWLSALSKLHTAHIFSRAHATEWNIKGYPALVTDTASSLTMGGSSKIGTVQNLLLLSAELHGPWADYDFGVDPDDDYRITAFVKGLDRIAGRTLNLEPMSDPSTRPLDELLRDHFTQCLLKHVKGSGERSWDYNHTFGIGAFNLSDAGVWGTAEGKERLELELENRLFEHRSQQEDGDEVVASGA